jgi:2-(1,2-epoxy-1,2-dihydrophenyl)acetyl-CoA isomerase
MSKTVLLTREGPIVTITLNRPQALNALNAEMSADFCEAVLTAEEDSQARCIVIRGAGDHFMAGGDVKTFAAWVKEKAPDHAVRFRSVIQPVHAAIQALRRTPKPVVAAVHGSAAGFGLSLVMACDLAVAADNTVFTLAYRHIGVSPDGSSTFSLPRMVGLKKAMELALLGDRFTAQAALDMGLINWVVPLPELAAKTTEVVTKLVTGPAEAMGRTKRLLGASLGNSLETQLAEEENAFLACTLGPEFAEGTAAFVEKRKAKFPT